MLKIQVKLDGSCLEQDKVTINDKYVVNIYIVYDVNVWPFKQSVDFTLCKYKYSGYGIEFDAYELFSLSDGGGFGINVIIYGGDMSSSVQVNSKKMYPNSW